MLKLLGKWLTALVEVHDRYHYNRGYQYAWDLMLNGVDPVVLAEEDSCNPFDIGVNAAIACWEEAAPYERY